MGSKQPSPAPNRDKDRKIVGLKPKPPVSPPPKKINQTIRKKYIGVILKSGLLVPRSKARPTLYCDIDCVLNNAWARIQKWAVPRYPGRNICSDAWSMEEVKKDRVLARSCQGVWKFAKDYNICYIVVERVPRMYPYTDNLRAWLKYHRFPLDQKKTHFNLHAEILITSAERHKVGLILSHQCRNQNPCLTGGQKDLVIDDFSMGLEYYEPYTTCYLDVIKSLENNGLIVECFNKDINNWTRILDEYYPMSDTVSEEINGDYSY